MSEIGEKITQLADALRLNKNIIYNGKRIMYVYLARMNFNTGDVIIRYSNLETESVNIFDLEVLELTEK